MTNLFQMAFTKFLENLNEQDAFIAACKKVFFHEMLPLDDIQNLAGECFLFQVDSENDYLSLEIRTLALLLLSKLSFQKKAKTLDLFIPIYKRILSFERYNVTSKSELLKQAIKDLLGLEEFDSFYANKDLQKTLLKVGSTSDDKELPNPETLAFKAILFGTFGIASQNQKLVDASVEIASFVYELSMKGDKAKLGLWQAEKGFNPSSYYMAMLLLFNLADFLTSDKVLKKTFQILWEKFTLDNFQINTVPPLYLLLMFWIEKLSRENPRILSNGCIDTFSSSERDRNLGVIQKTIQNRSLTLTFSGNHSGLGSFEKNDVTVVSFGPHLTPLGESSLFGIYRVPSLNERAFKDLVIKEDDLHFEGSAWSRLVSRTDMLSSHWIFTEATLTDKALFLNFELKQLGEKESVYMAFFVNAKKARVSSLCHLQSKSLDRYEGKSDKVVFDGDTSSLCFELTGSTDMQVIPLEGQKYFWQSDFLIAYKINSDHNFNLKIS